MSAPVHVQIVFLTGRSDPGNTALGPLQERFLRALAAPARTLVARNFPWAPPARPFRATPLWRASRNNLRDWATARGASFAREHAAAARELLAAAPHTVLLAGSCGLALLRGLALPADLLARVSVFAFGPVVRWRPAARCCAVVGARDWLARALGGRADVRVPGGHLDYLRQPEVAAACERFVAAVERALAGGAPPASTPAPPPATHARGGAATPEERPR